MALKVTVPFPLPLAPPLIVSQAALLAASTCTRWPPSRRWSTNRPPRSACGDVGETPKVQLIPLCVTVTVCPATVSVPTRCAVDVFAVALKVTVPFPLPLAPPLIVSQALLLAAVHVQPLAAVTAVVDEPAAEVSVGDVGETPNVQLIPLCVTVTVWPATVSVPTRCAVDVFAVALKVTVPLPLPLAPPLTLSQAALLVAVQAHPAPAVTPVVERAGCRGQRACRGRNRKRARAPRTEKCSTGPSARCLRGRRRPRWTRYTMPGDGNAARIDESRTLDGAVGLGRRFAEGLHLKGLRRADEEELELVAVDDRDAVLHHGMAARCLELRRRRVHHQLRQERRGRCQNGQREDKIDRTSTRDRGTESWIVRHRGTCSAGSGPVVESALLRSNCARSPLVATVELDRTRHRIVKA